MRQPLEYWSLLQVSEALRRGELSSVEATQAMLDRIGRLDGSLRSFNTVTADRALAHARQADAEIAAGFSRGPLHGVPLAVKDLCFTRDAPTSAGMTIHKDWVPDFDATVVRRLDAAGAVILGKLHMTEGAALHHHPDMPAPRNPWNPDYWPGVSSSGSGVAVAAGLCYGATGSDTGGSIRFPSSACGLTGIKPTWGRVSRHGIFPLAESLDHIGPMARTAGDAAAMLGAMAGEDPEDPTSLDALVPDYLAALGANIRGVRIGVDPVYAGEGVDSEVTAALADAERALAGLGANIRQVRFPAGGHGRAAAVGLAIEIAHAHRETFPARAAEYGPELAKTIEAGLKTSPLAAADALRSRRIFAGEVNRLWRDIDLLLIPALPSTTPTVEAAKAMGGAQIGQLSRFTLPFNLTGLPTITLPCGVSKGGLPIGMQLVGQHLSEPLLCRAGHAFQRATDWHTRHPAL